MSNSDCIPAPIHLHVSLSDCSLHSLFFEVIVSLYWDQIKPTDGDISRRFSELWPNATAPSQDEIVLSLVRYPDIYRIMFERDGRYYVCLLVPPVWFLGWIDPCDPSLEYTGAVWAGLSHFIVCLCINDSRNLVASGLRRFQFKGGRYGLAKTLQSCILELYKLDTRVIACEDCDSFFRSIQFFSLGHISHLIQTSISRGMLRYEDNLLQPAAACSVPSLAYASKLIQQEVFDEDPEICPEIRSVAELTTAIHKLFEKENVCELPLSQLKKKLITHFHMVLNPAGLGFVKLSDLVRSLDSVHLVSEGNNSIIVKMLTPSTGIRDA